MVMDPFSARMLKNAGIAPISQGRGPVVLMYHSIEPAESPSYDQWSLTPQLFRAHLDLLKKEGWHTARVKDLLEPESLPPRTLVITFDDGYANNYESGFKPLLDFGMQATWFVVTGDVGKHSSWSGASELSRPMLSVGQLCEMDGAGMEIGAHTRTHPRLYQLKNETIQEEVSESKKELEDMLGRPVISFAYPYGEFDKTYINAVKNAGFNIACSTRPGWLGSDLDLFQIRRVAVFADDSPSVLARKLAFADNDVAWSRMAKYAVGRLKSRLF